MIYFLCDRYLMYIKRLMRKRYIESTKRICSLIFFSFKSFEEMIFQIKLICLQKRTFHLIFIKEIIVANETEILFNVFLIKFLKLVCDDFY